MLKLEGVEVVAGEQGVITLGGLTVLEIQGDKGLVLVE
jgi:hypothetical protein